MNLEIWIVGICQIGIGCIGLVDVLLTNTKK